MFMAPAPRFVSSSWNRRFSQCTLIFSVNSSVWTRSSCFWDALMSNGILSRSMQPAPSAQSTKTFSSLEFEMVSISPALLIGTFQLRRTITIILRRTNKLCLQLDIIIWTRKLGFSNIDRVTIVLASNYYS